MLALLCATLALGFPKFTFLGRTHACFDPEGLCRTPYQSLPAALRASYPIAPYAPGRYVHVQRRRPSRFAVRVACPVAEWTWAPGEFADVRTAAVAGQYADITGKPWEEVLLDLGLRFDRA